MKQILSTVFILFFMASGHLFGQCGNLYIGGVIDGPLTGGTPKGIQICASGDVTNISIYGIGVANNGGGSDGQEYTFPAEAVSSGDCFWVAHEGSNPGSFSAFFGFAPCYINTISNINGDDPVELFCSGGLEDEFGDVALDGSGECWEYQDGWAVNNSGAPNSGTFSCTDWTFSGPNALDGESSNAGASTPYPSPTQSCPVTLPVNLTSFSAKFRNNSVRLSWTTASEQNNDYFSIQHSVDGRTFQEIDRVNGVGTSNVDQKYSFTHKQPKDGLNYYRLQQNDLDGQFEYSYIVKIDNKSNSIKIYPTNIINTINIEIEDTESANLTILNFAGQIFKEVSLNSTENSIDISELPFGIYYAKVESSSQFLVERIVKY